VPQIQAYTDAWHSTESWSEFRVFAITSCHEPPLIHTRQMHMCYCRSLIASSTACKIVRTTCQTGRWRCVLHVQSTRELTLFGTPGHNGFFPRTIVALVRKFQPYTFYRCLDRAGPPCCTRVACLADGQPELVGVIIQFPNIAESAVSDLSYIRILLTVGRLLSRGLFLDKTLAVLPTLLFCTGGLGRVGADARFKVAWVWEGSTDRVLVMENMDGTSVGGRRNKSFRRTETRCVPAAVLSSTSCSKLR